MITLRAVDEWLHGALGLDPGATPFPWQSDLLQRFLSGTGVRAVDVPTGLGKTAVMAIWLVARAAGAQVSRRLVYVVDRRAVVDQATRVAMDLREWLDRTPKALAALALDRSLPISTLRGQFIDNREWLDDPTSPAIIVGTVDMVGSRLLFEGYGTSRKMRPYHAALLGSDALIVLDEAHLVPPFEHLIRSVVEGSSPGGELGTRGDETPVPSMQLLSLSATGRMHDEGVLELGEADFRHEVVKRRLRAPKRVSMVDVGGQKLPQSLAAEAWRLSSEGARPVRCVVFSTSREVARSALEELGKLAKDATIECDLFVGGRRGLERDHAATRLESMGFLAGRPVDRDHPAFLFATSAGEVGVDLDAEHMVGDLVAWERMVQRFGRVNRRGHGEADIVIVMEQPKPTKKEETALATSSEALREADLRVIEAYQARATDYVARKKPFELLPVGPDGRWDASLHALQDLRRKARKDRDVAKALNDATTAAPLRPAISRPLIDAWAMTAIKVHTGRPEIAAWLRGWIDEDEPQSTVAWRRFIPQPATEESAHERAYRSELERFFEAAATHASESLEIETRTVVECLLERAQEVRAALDGSGPVPSQAPGQAAHLPIPLTAGSVVAVCLDSAGEPSAAWRLSELVPPSDFQRDRLEKDLCRALRERALVLDARLGGLDDNGLLSPKSTRVPRTIDDGSFWMDAADAAPPAVRFSVRWASAGQHEASEGAWRERLRVPFERSDDGEATSWLVVWKWRSDAATEEDRSAGSLQLLIDHQAWAADEARRLGERLHLPEAYVTMLEVAARLHDEGKRAARWQRAFNAPPGGPYAKTPGPVNIALLDHYRHEFGSLPIAECNPAILSLDPELRELALHLIAAHHGFSRPIIAVTGCEDAPPSVLAARARDVALRFAKLHAHWGPWGLAWWESLLRAADQKASKRNEETTQMRRGGS